MNINPRSGFKFGNSTLQGGLTQREVVQEIYTFQLPDFQVSTAPVTEELTILENYGNFGSPLTYQDEDGNDIVYGYEWGTDVTFNKVLIDNYNVLRESETLLEEYYSVDLTNAFLEIGTGNDRQVIDNRLGDFRMSFNLDLEQNAIGSRTLAFMGWIWEPKTFTVNYHEPLWAQTFLPAADGTSVFHIETQRFGFNLLELRRKAIARTPKYTGKKEDLRMSISFVLHQSSGDDLILNGATLWLKKTSELIDPDRFKGSIQ